MQTNHNDIETQWNQFCSAIHALTKLEAEETLAQDGYAGRRLDRHSASIIIETADAVLFRNLFPDVTPEQREALLDAYYLGRAMERVRAGKIEGSDALDIQHGHEAKKALVRHLLPLDEVKPLQRYYLETVLLK